MHAEGFDKLDRYEGESDGNWEFDTMRSDILLFYLLLI